MFRCLLSLFFQCDQPNHCNGGAIVVFKRCACLNDAVAYVIRIRYGGCGRMLLHMTDFRALRYIDFCTFVVVV